MGKHNRRSTLSWNKTSIHDSVVKSLFSWADTTVNALGEIESWACGPTAVIHYSGGRSHQFETSPVYDMNSRLARQSYTATISWETEAGGFL